ncbi:MAG: hypothetical protein IKN37_03820 [Bacteroidales bacterium]|nr:hypothetical protein [Bacteroidales bacterium]
MNKERIFVKIKELQDKIRDLDQRLSAPGEAVSALDLDTQLMYLRLMYDCYLSLRGDLRPEGRKRGKGKQEPQVKEQPKEQPEEPEVENERPEVIEASLPLVFSEAEEVKQEPEPEQEPKTEPEPVPETEAEPQTEPEAKTEPEPQTEPEVKTEPEPETEPEQATEPEPEPEQVNLEEDAIQIPDIDLNSIEFEDEPDGDDDVDEEPAPAKKIHERFIRALLSRFEPEGDGRGGRDRLSLLFRKKLRDYFGRAFRQPVPFPQRPALNEKGGGPQSRQPQTAEPD